MSRPIADNWKACPPGELGRLSTRLRSRRTRRTVARSGVAVALLAVFAMGFWMIRFTDGFKMDMNFADIRCSRVIALAQDYATHKLDSKLSDQIKLHVHQCPRCHKRFKDMGMVSIHRKNMPSPHDSTIAKVSKNKMLVAYIEVGVGLAGN